MRFNIASSRVRFNIGFGVVPAIQTRRVNPQPLRLKFRKFTERDAFDIDEWMVGLGSKEDK